MRRTVALMPDYRFYAGGSSGLAWVPVSDECGSDADAFMVAERLASDLMGAEVWKGSRLVCKVPPKCHVTRQQAEKRWPASR